MFESYGSEIDTLNRFATFAGSAINSQLNSSSPQRISLSHSVELAELAKAMAMIGQIHAINNLINSIESLREQVATFDQNVCMLIGNKM